MQEKNKIIYSLILVILFANICFFTIYKIIDKKPITEKNEPSQNIIIEEKNKTQEEIDNKIIEEDKNIITSDDRLLNGEYKYIGTNINIPTSFTMGIKVNDDINIEIKNNDIEIKMNDAKIIIENADAKELYWYSLKELGMYYLAYITNDGTLYKLDKNILKALKEKNTNIIELMNNVLSFVEVKGELLTGNGLNIDGNYGNKDDLELYYSVKDINGNINKIYLDI